MPSFPKWCYSALYLLCIISINSWRSRFDFLNTSENKDMIRWYLAFLVNYMKHCQDAARCHRKTQFDWKTNKTKHEGSFEVYINLPNLLNEININLQPSLTSERRWWQDRWDRRYLGKRCGQGGENICSRWGGTRTKTDTAYVRAPFQTRARPL